MAVTREEWEIQHLDSFLPLMGQTQQNEEDFGRGTEDGPHPKISEYSEMKRSHLGQRLEAKIRAEKQVALKNNGPTIEAKTESRNC